MPDKCSVPNCKGNYKTGPKVSVFGFPGNPELKQKWLHAIKRKEFVPSKRSKVCEVHFQTDDILRTHSAFDEKTGRRLTCMLKHPKLRPGAIPSLFPICPVYSSKPASKAPRLSRRDMLQKRKEKQLARLAKALAQSKEAERRREEQDSCQTHSDIIKKLVLKKPWQYIDDNSEEITICTVKNSEQFGPQINSAVLINKDLTLNVFINSEKLSQINWKKLPLKVDRISTIKQICEAASRINSLDTD